MQRSSLWGAMLLLLGTLSLILTGCGGGDNGPQASNVDPSKVVTLNLYNDITTGVRGDAEWVAFQDGVNGPWKQLTKVSAGVYKGVVTNSSGAYGFAIVNESSFVGYDTAVKMSMPESNTMVQIFQGTLEDGNTLNLSQNPYMSRKSLSVKSKTSSRAGSKYYYNYPISFTLSGTPDDATNFTLSTVDGDSYTYLNDGGQISGRTYRYGTQDLAFTFYTESPDGSNLPKYLAVKRNLAVPSTGLADQEFDMSSYTTLTPTTLAGSADLDCYVDLITKGGTVTGLSAYSYSGDLPVAAVPQATLEDNGDYYCIYRHYNRVESYSYAQTLSDGVTLPTTPFLFHHTIDNSVLSLTDFSYADAKYYWFNVTSPTNGIPWNVMVSKSWLEASGQTGDPSFAVPSFDGVGSFSAKWALDAGATATRFSGTAVDTNMPLGDALSCLVLGESFVPSTPGYIKLISDGAYVD